MARQALIIGTSNSIRSLGYRPALESLLEGWDIRLAGLGATTGVLLPYELAAADLSSVEAVIVDVNVNDSVHVATGSFSAELANAMLFDGLQHIRARGAAPILLLMPNNHDLTWEGERSGRRLARQRAATARAMGITVIDGFGIVDILTSLGVSEEALFDDVAHAGLPVVIAVAQELVAVLGALPPRGQAVDVPPPPFPWLPSALRAVAQKLGLKGGAPARSARPAPGPPPFFRWLPPAVEGRGVERSSSLLSVRYRVFGEQEALEVELEEEATLLDISMNHRSTHGSLTITADTGAEVVLRFDGRLESDDPRVKLMHVVAHLPEGLAGRRFSLRLERARRKLPPASAEFEALVFRRGRMEDMLGRWRALAAAAADAGPVPGGPVVPAHLRLVATYARGQEARSSVGGARRLFRAMVRDEARYRAGDHDLLLAHLSQLGAQLGEPSFVERFVSIRKAIEERRGAPAAEGDDAGAAQRAAGEGNTAA